MLHHGIAQALKVIIIFSHPRYHKIPKLFRADYLGDVVLGTEAYDGLRKEGSCQPIPFEEMMPRTAPLRTGRPLTEDIPLHYDLLDQAITILLRAHINSTRMPYNSST